MIEVYLFIFLCSFGNTCHASYTSDGLGGFVVTDCNLCRRYLRIEHAGARGRGSRLRRDPSTLVRQCSAGYLRVTVTSV